MNNEEKGNKFNFESKCLCLQGQNTAISHLYYTFITRACWLLSISNLSLLWGQINVCQQTTHIIQSKFLDVIVPLFLCRVVEHKGWQSFRWVCGSLKCLHSIIREELFRIDCLLLKAFRRWQKLSSRNLFLAPCTIIVCWKQYLPCLSFSVFSIHCLLFYFKNHHQDAKR